jgi:hypothetical protein
VEHYDERKILLANNCYWKTTGSGEFKINGKWYSYDNYRTKYKNNNSVLQDPGFKDILIHDFTLLDSSQCLSPNMFVVTDIPVYSYLGALAHHDRNLHGPTLLGLK